MLKITKGIARLNHGKEDVLNLVESKGKSVRISTRKNELSKDSIFSWIP